MIINRGAQITSRYASASTGFAEMSIGCASHTVTLRGLDRYENFDALRKPESF